MAREWEYAELTKKARLMGGAKKVMEYLDDIDTIKENEFRRGGNAMLKKVAPLFVVTALMGHFVPKGCQKLIQKKAERDKREQYAADKAREAEARLRDHFHKEAEFADELVAEVDEEDPNENEKD